MEKRRLGRTEHMSTVIAFGAASFFRISQKEADGTMDLLMERGINHIDVAPEYGEAEARVGSWVKRYREKYFLGCKTLKRTRKEAYSELQNSLELLHTDFINLYQLHSVDELSELDTALGPSGAMEAIVEARNQGKVEFIGITSHNLSLLLRALEFFEFDTIMFPLNYIFYADQKYRSLYKRLMKIVKQRDIGVMIIKSIAKKNWDEEYQALPMLERPFMTWYEPFHTSNDINRAVSFVLAQDIATVVSASDTRLVPLMIDAAEQFQPLTQSQHDALLKEGENHKILEFTF